MLLSAIKRFHVSGFVAEMLCRLPVVLGEDLQELCCQHHRLVPVSRGIVWLRMYLRIMIRGVTVLPEEYSMPVPRGVYVAIDSNLMLMST